MTARRHKRGYKFTEKKQSVRGILALVLTLVSIGLFAGAVVNSFQSSGNGSMYLGSVGVTSMLLTFVAFVLALISLREENSFKLFPYLATVFSFLTLGIWIALYVVGFML